MRPDHARLIGRALLVLASAIILIATFAVWLAGAR